MDLLEPIRPILDAIQAAGGRPLVVGGAVRDWLLGRAAQDLDVEVYGLDVDQLAAVLSALGRVDAVGRSFGVLKLRAPGGRVVDVSVPLASSRNPSGQRGFIVAPDPQMEPRAAAARRDFTWNAMALTPDGRLLDWFGGAEDLRAGVIRHASPAFVEDPLRPLRAVQFAARFDMRLAPETAALCRTMLTDADGLPVERVWGEWHKWGLQGARPSAGLRVLRETGWLARYPELAALVDCPQDLVWHPEGDVWTHTGLVCDAASAIADRDSLDGRQRAVLLFAALCHDFGKPATTTQDGDGRIRARGHDRAGVAPTESFLERIGAPRALGTRVVRLVREHLVHLGAQPTARTIRRLAVRLNPASIEEWDRLVEADHSGRPPLPPGNPARPFTEVARQLGVARARPEPLIQGRHLLAAGMEEGPAIGALVRRAYRAQIDGAFETVEEGLAWLRRHGRPGL